ncbi:flagellar hook-associated protein FlgK [Novosphingobium aquimarinum]|uniref:flagellar hook-associated protein FlgK n=1 Tax=Novosphingobium aquimarinum TaxID=2682494 RepID=UPI0012EC75EE|nr:flagellar hook-associated protein FlgK [Novosphingobium aquimarinum]
MASDLLAIAKSGARAARTALDVTAQNISNASSAGYVRRSVSMQEVSSGSRFSALGDLNLSGVRVSGVVRNADAFRQSEVRRTGADSARANAEVRGLENIESAIEQTQVYQSIVAFESSVQQLLADPTDGSLRAATLESARTMANTLNIASNSLDTAGKGLRFEAQDGVDQVNRIAGELARVNLRLSRASDASNDQSSLLDQRDTLLEQMSQYVDISATINSDKTASVTIGNPTGPALVVGGATASLSMATAADGTVSFAVDGSAVALSSGSIAGHAQVLTKLAETKTNLDAIAAEVVSVVNATQANGVDLDGNPGQPIFSGTTAADIGIALANGRGIATAPAGAGANSRDPGNLVALRTALDTSNPATAMDSLLFDVSSAVSGRKITRDALDSIASTARVALEAQSGVDLDQEAVNLVRFQQAFQANGRVMQVAQDLFDTLMGIR